jgi:vacuolar-type H+-ATPase subunit C/Vma6
VNVYAVARVRGLRGRLLGQRRLYELAGQPGLAAKLDLLRHAGLCSASSATLAEAERDLERALARDIAFVDALIEGDPVVRAVLAIGDAWILKTILRGVAHSEPSSRLLALSGGSLELDAGALKELVAQRTVKAVIDLLVTWGSPYGTALLDAPRELPALALTIDRVALGRAAAAAAGAPPVARLVEELVDRLNAVTLLEVSGEAAARDLFLEGGRALGRRRFERLARSPAAEMRAALAADPALGLAPAFVDGVADPFLLDRLLRRRPLEALRRAARVEPLSVCVPLLYLLERQEETRAARTILEGGEVGLPAPELVTLVEGNT